MKTSHHCPKCDSRKIVVFQGSAFNQTTIGATTKWGMQSAILDRYFCADCGYTEEYARMDKKFRKWANEKLRKDGYRDDGFV